MTDTLHSVTLDPETERLARRLAAAANKPLEQIVREAIAARALDLGMIPPAPPSRVTPAEIRAATDDVVARLRALPVLDARLPDEILGYDDHGLPR